MNLHTYRLTVDDGSAPNPYGGICSLAICKPRIRKRKVLKKGDWIVGFVGKTLSKTDENNLLYAMKVSEIITFEEYNIFCETKCQEKIPSKTQKTGDCIYFKEDQVFRQRPNYAHHKGNMENDINGINVILGKEFYYFGKNSIKIPNKFKNIIPKNQEEPYKPNKHLAIEFEKKIRSEIRDKQGKYGIIGNPYNEMSKNIVRNKSKCGKKIKGCKKKCSLFNLKKHEEERNKINKQKEKEKREQYFNKQMDIIKNGLSDNWLFDEINNELEKSEKQRKNDAIRREQDANHREIIIKNRLQKIKNSKRNNDIINKFLTEDFEETKL